MSDDPPIDDVQPEAEPEETPLIVEKLDRYGRGEDGLTPMQRVFIEEVRVDWNYTQAAIRAGYSPKTAKDIGHENMRKPAIIDAIMRAMAGTDPKNINRQWVLMRLVQTERDAAAVEGGKGRRDRLRALELIGKHVDIMAFRTQFGIGRLDGGELIDWDYSQLTDEELDEFERLLAKITRRSHADGSPDGGLNPALAGGEGPFEGPGEAPPGP